MTKLLAATSTVWPSGAGHGFGADQGARAGAVLDGHGLAEVGLQGLGELAGDEVHRGAGGLGHDHPDRPRRVPGARLRAGGCGKHRQDGESGTAGGEHEASLR